MAWLDFLLAAAERGFRDTAPEQPTARELLRAVYAAVDARLSDRHGRKDVEAAIAAFAEHPDIAASLE